MTPPHPAFTLCRCAHTRRRHFEMDGPCDSAACGCGSFRQGAEQADAVAEVVALRTPVARAAVRASAPPATTVLRTLDRCGLVSPAFRNRPGGQQYPCTLHPDHRGNVHVHQDERGQVRARWTNPLDIKQAR